ncbi:MAG TPA: hypothetical protein VJI13_06635 [Candidatus Norongarragalinales archaeon]|nr:hypothetical protein [Candidatus Norongarragalinales archaeon]
MPIEVFRKLLESEGVKSAFFGRIVEGGGPVLGIKTDRPMELLRQTGIKFDEDKQHSGQGLYKGAIVERRQWALDPADKPPERTLILRDPRFALTAHVGQGYLLVGIPHIVPPIETGYFERMFKALRSEGFVLIPVKDSLQKRRELPTLLRIKDSYRIGGQKHTRVTPQ